MVPALFKPPATSGRATVGNASAVWETHRHLISLWPKARSLALCTTQSTTHKKGQSVIPACLNGRPTAQITRSLYQLPRGYHQRVVMEQGDQRVGHLGGYCPPSRVVRSPVRCQMWTGLMGLNSQAIPTQFNRLMIETCIREGGGLGRGRVLVKLEHRIIS